jgi:predicted GNAT family acetyltransferase
MPGKMLILHDKQEIEAFLRQDLFLHLYSLGDLDDFFWHDTIWYAAKQHGQLEAIALFYIGQPPPVLLALGDEFAAMQDLLQSILPLLPNRFYAHFSPGLEDVLAPQYRIQSYGAHYKMGLIDQSKLVTVDTSQVIRLSTGHLEDVMAFYRASYPGNWFDPRMLETNQYFAIKGDEGLLSVAGIHVYSERYKVAALGNIATRPGYRGRRLGRAVTARLCQSLAETVDHIALNVRTDNRPAIALYEKLGFEILHTYGEYMVEAR